MIYVVLGMHKSGTSLVSQILHLSGINMEDNVDVTKGYDEGNRFERSSVKELNKELLGSGSDYSLNVILKKPVQLRPDHRQKMQTIIQMCNERNQDWGFKDPRTCLTYPAWAQALPSHKIIAVYRSYKEVLYHYTRRKWTRINFFYVLKALRGWIHYNTQMIAHLEKTNYPYIIINYNELMKNNERFDQLSKFVDRSLIDCRNDRSYRNRQERLPFMARLAMLLLAKNPSKVWDELQHVQYLWEGK